VRQRATGTDTLINILEMTNGSHEILVQDGEPVISEGDRSGALFVLVEGALEVRRHDRAIARIADPGAIVGELGLLLDIPASADVIACGACTVRRMDDAAATFDSNPEFARHLATLLARRLWQISTYLSDLQEQYADREDTIGLMPTVLRELLDGTRPPAEPGSERETDSPY